MTFRFSTYVSLVPAVAMMALLSGCGDTQAPGVRSETAPAVTGAQTSVTVTTTTTAADPADAFMREAAQGNMAEIELGKLAESKGVTPEAKNFGKQMVADHTDALGKIKQLAARKNITLPTELSAEDASLKSKLQNLNGGEFDKAYTHAMVQDHVKDVAAFERQSNNGADSDVKALATELLPTLKHHLSMAQDADRRLASGTALTSNPDANPTEVSHTSTSTTLSTDTKTEKSR